MKIGMKEDVDVAVKITLSNLVLHSLCNYVQSAPKRTYLQFMVIKGKDWDENVHEGGHRRCQ